MLRNTISAQPRALSESMLAVSRQVWLASLGAAFVTREWAQKEAGKTLKTLVREGTVVESRAIRFVGDQLEASVIRANSAWKDTQRQVASTVKQAAETTIALATRVLPKTLPAIALPSAVKVTAPAAKRVKKTAPSRKAQVAKSKRRIKNAAR